MDLTQFVPMFGNFAFMIAAFVVALSVIVAIHEYGHYIIGRWSGIHAEVFSLGFGPVLFSRYDKRGTKWQVAALPLGGYVKFLGDADPASAGVDKSLTDVDPRSTMAGAPLWARSATVAAGPIFNFILAIAIFAGSIMYQGRSLDPLTFGEMRDLPAQFDSELLPGDVMLAVEGVAFSTENIDDLIPLRERLDYTVMRDGEEITVEGPYLLPPAASGISPRSAADDAGLRVGDVIVAADDVPVFAFAQLVDVVQAAEGAALDLTVLRDDVEIAVTLAPRVTAELQDDGTFENVYRIGVAGQLFFEEQTESVGLFEAVKVGSTSLWRNLSGSISGMKHIILGTISTCNLGGPVAIAETSGSMAEQGAQSFIWFIGMLSAAVGMINLFPIPVLDGGHLTFHLYEAVTRRKPNEQVIRVFMLVGLGLILSMMSFTILNDLLLCP